MAKDIRVTLELDNRQFKNTINQSERQVKSFEGSSTKSLFNIRNAFLAIAGSAVIRGIAQTGASFQQLQNSLNVVFGSAEAGADAFERVKDIASGTQFSVQQLTQAFVQLKGAGVEPTEDLLLTFADTASVTTDQMGTFQAALDLVSRSTAGGLGLEDLNRLADRGIPVFRILQERLGLARLEISEFGKTTEGANTIVRELLAGLQEDFGGALGSQVGLINFELSQLGDALDNLAGSIFANFEEAGGQAIRALTNAINDLANNTELLNATLNTLGNLLEIIAGAFLIFRLGSRDALGAFERFVSGLKTFFAGGIIGTLIARFKDLGMMLGALRKGFTGLTVGGFIVALGGAGAAALPVSAIITGLVLALDGLIRLFTDTSLLGILGDVVNMFKLLFNAINPFKKEVEEVNEVVEEETEKTVENTEATKEAARQKELAALAEESFEKGLRKATKAIKEQTGVLDKNDPLAEYADFLAEIIGNSNKLAVEQVFAGRAVEAINDLFDKGLISTRAYKIALEDLFGIIGVDPFTDFEDSLEGVTLTTEEYAEKQRQLNALIQKYPELTDAAARAQDTLNDALADNEGLVSFLNTLGRAQKTLSMDLAKSLTEGKDAAESFKNFFRQVVNQIIADAIRLAVIQPILSAIFGIEFGAGGVVTGLTGGGLFGLFKADGGPVMSNKPYIVGERGPELFVPNAGGTIIPNDRLMTQGGGDQVSYTINAVDAPSFQALVASDPEFIYNVTRVGARRLPGAR